MGTGIAFVAAARGRFPVTLIDANPAALDKAVKFVDKLLEKQVSKSRLTSTEANEIKSRLSWSSEFTETVEKADFVIEAVPEVAELKQKIFGDLAKAVGSSTILGTNTSSISITKIAAAAKGAEDRVVGVHFFNPVPVQKGAEVIRAQQTSDETHRAALELMERLGKVPSTSQDVPGFIANRLLVPYVNDAVLALEHGIGNAEDIDNIMVNGCAMPMGPLRLADFIGLDTCLSILEVLRNETGDPKYRPSALMKRLVDAGHLGVKTGRGIYNYSSK